MVSRLHTFTTPSTHYNAPFVLQILPLGFSPSFRNYLFSCGDDRTVLTYITRTEHELRGNLSDSTSGIIVASRAQFYKHDSACVYDGIAKCISRTFPSVLVYKLSPVTHKFHGVRTMEALNAIDG